MTDNDLLDGFRNGTLPADGFDHRRHLHLAWLYLQHWGLGETLRRFSDDLRSFAEARGVPDLFHATITWAFLFALDARRRTLPATHHWDELASRSPELFDWKAFLGRYYSAELLESDLARAGFVLPDRIGV